MRPAWKKPDRLEMQTVIPENVKTICGFIRMSDEEIEGVPDGSGLCHEQGGS